MYYLRPGDLIDTAGHATRTQKALQKRKTLYLAACLLSIGILYRFVHSPLGPRDDAQADMKDPQAFMKSQQSTWPTKPACTIWPDWRQSIPTPAPADDAALPASRMGTTEVMGGSTKHGCVPADERLGPFGHDNVHGKSPDAERPWQSLRWGRLQQDCTDNNFALNDRTTARRLSHVTPQIDADLKSSRLDSRQTGRTALVLRTWDAYRYSENQVAWMRVMITELSLDTGGAFQLFILVDVKDPSLDLLDNGTYDAVLQRSVPAEFRDTALLWNEALLREWFPKVGKYDAQDQMYQALQVFSYTFPEFDYVWQIEMDARFTGNIATMLTNAAHWAAAQPRKNLWERNGRWFIPGLWHNYSEFAAHVDQEFSNRQGTWGPHHHADFFVDPQGPTPPEKSQFSWGVGEAADLITFAPMIDPANTKWTYENTVHGFTPAWELPRRMAIVSMTRTSRRLLRLIAQKQRESGSWVVSESTPETWSLLHGLKAVYVPHLFAFKFEAGDRSPQELDQMFHKGPAWSLAGGDQAGFLYCGPNIGLPEFRWLDATYFWLPGQAPGTWWSYTNGTCTWPLLLHPVKHG